MITSALNFILGLIPASKFKNFLLNCLGHKISKFAVVHSLFLIGKSKLLLEDNSRISPLNVVRNTRVEMGKNSLLGSFNWITSAKSLVKTEGFQGILRLNTECDINSRNYLDCTGGIFFGDFSGLAGVRSTLLTHQIDYRTARQTCKRIQIGNHTLISSNVKIVPGAKIGNRSLFAMGSVITAKEYPDGYLFSGIPAIKKKPIDGKYFFRDQGPCL